MSSIEVKNFGWKKKPVKSTLCLLQLCSFFQPSCKRLQSCQSAENARATNTQQHFIQTLQTIQWFAVRSKETPSFMARRPATSQPHVPRRVAVQAEANRALRYASQMFSQELIPTTRSRHMWSSMTRVTALLVHHNSLNCSTWKVMLLSTHLELVRGWHKPKEEEP